MKKRIVCMLLVFSMLLTMLPVTAFADSPRDDSAQVENPFGDVSKSDWFYDSVMYARSNGLFAGVSADRFDPQGTMTRAMYVTVMGRMAEIDTAPYGGRSDFHDVDATSWYGPYLAWAVEQGIVKGVGGGRFDPDGLITREQMATMTVRFFDVYQIAYPPSTIATEPADAPSVSDYAKHAVSKFWQCGLFQGDSAGKFSPKANASRAEAATFCMRADEIVEQWLIDTGKKEDPEKKKKPVRYTYYQVTFESNGGSKVDSFSRREGSGLGNLPTPYKANNIFHGWCYDQALERLVSSSDTLLENTTLYAKWGVTAPLPEDETPAFARAIDAATNFTIKITAPDGWTAERVMQAITVKNLSSNEEKPWVEVTKSGNIFVVSGVNYEGVKGTPQAGFIAGANYKLTLDDDALVFDGQDAATREYDFTIAKPNVMNVSLNEDLTYISAGKLSDLVVNGKPATEISVAVITVGQDGSTTENGTTVGSFTYTEGTLAVGDSVGIYEGDEAPDMNSSAAGDEMSFVTITAANGTSYDYQGAATEDVLFMPDVLPVPKAADTDGNAHDLSITVPMETMTYTDDKYADLGLTSQTTVDAGDFISFYGGTLETGGADATAAGYARIETVEEQEDNYIITYTTVTQAEMMEAMAAYRKEHLEGETLMEGVDKEEIERSVEQQARDSGFANEAGMYLAAMALETDSFTEISEDFDLSEYSVTMPEGMTRSGLAQMKGVNVSAEVTTLQATISTQLVHFEDLSGLRLTLTVGVEVTIGDNIKIEISGNFEQEVKIELGVDGNAVWKWWFIFPYIAEYQVTAWVDLYTFTGIGIEATITTTEADDDEGMGTGNETVEDIGQQIKDLLDEKDKYLGDGEDTVASTLEEKYAEMLENESDWVDLFEKTIFEKHFRIILIIDIEIKVSFVVSANLNISLGLDFWYENAKRYIYTVEIFSREVRNDTIDLRPEHYEFEFYVMGTMGLRAGVRASIAVGLFSTKLASVGFTAEAGVYVKVWGYFYYHLVFDANASPQKTTYYAGALLFELGIYLEITFLAQAFNGTFSYNPTLLDKEWPLWSAGLRENIRNFAYGKEDTPALKLKKSIQSTILPDDLFEMACLDLKSGESEDKIFDDSAKYFTIEMTNSKFSYDRATNELTVSPGEEDINLDGEMILTWVNQPLAFSSASIQRRISLHWDNLNDGYVIVFHTDGGSSTPLIVGRYGAAIKSPQDPVKKGYVFAGWHSDEALTQTYLFPETMPNADIELYAKWTPAEDTPYRVEHYGEVLGSSQYDLLESAAMRGTTDSEVAAPLKSYTGYVTPQAKSVKILPDGSAVLRYYYDLAAYTLTFDPGVAQGEKAVTTLKYGAVITPPVFNAKGYTFASWDAEVTSHMPAQDLTYVAQWQAGADTPYRVEYYVEQPDGRFALQHLEDKTGVTGGKVDASTLLDSRYLVPDGISYQNVTAGGVETTQPTITQDGKLIIKVNYKRVTHTATYSFENGASDRVDTYRYGARITRPEDPTRPGYTFIGWDAEISEIMGTTDLQFTAQWRANDDTAYKVEHYLQNANDDGFTLTDTDQLTGTTDTQAVAEARDYPFFTLNEGTQGSIAGDGSLTLKLYYNRQTFTVNYTVDDVPHADAQSYKHGQTVVYPAEPEKEGYNFGYWALDGAAFGGVMPTQDITLTAQWLPLTDYAYTVNYFQEGLNGGANILVRSESPTDEFGSEVTVTPTDDYEGFTAPAEQTVTIAKGLVVDHVYTRNSYALTWDFDGGTPTNESAYTKAGQVQFETPLVAPLLTKTGYTYVWNQAIASKMGTDDLAYTAEWTPNTYTVALNANGGAGSIENMTFTYDAAQLLTTNTYTRSGYTFSGWAHTADAKIINYADGASVKNLTAAVGGTVTLYAVWEPITYTINYELDGGVNYADNPYSYTIADNVSLDEPTKTGYTFEGWYFDAGLTSKVTGIAITAGSTGAKTFHAKWTANSYALTLDKNTGDGATETQQFLYDTEQAIKKNTFTREGCSFAGWNTNADGTGVAYMDGQTVKNLLPTGSVRLYAQWTLDTYTITYDLRNGANAAGNPESYTVVSGDITLKPATRDGFVFMGWFDGDTEVKEIKRASTGDRTLTAKWGYRGKFKMTTVDNVFTITRLESDDPNDVQHVGEQKVYYRTVNGTAIGGTHFVHQSGEAAFVTFGNGETSKTVTITETPNAVYKNPIDSKPYPATAYSTVDRQFSLELVRVDGGGVLDTSATKSTKTQPLSPEKLIPMGFYENTVIKNIEGELAISSSNYDANGSHQFSISDYTIDGIAYSDRLEYFKAGNDPLNERLQLKVYLSGKNTIKTNVIKITDLTTNTSKEYTTFRPSTEWTKIEVPGTTFAYHDLPLDTKDVKISYRVDGSSSWQVKDISLALSLFKSKSVSQIGVAPMAPGEYKAGETVTISILLNRIWMAADNNNAILEGDNLDGKGTLWGNSSTMGTNVLAFNVKVKNDCNAETLLNNLKLTGSVIW